MYIRQLEKEVIQLKHELETANGSSPFLFPQDTSTPRQRKKNSSSRKRPPSFPLQTSDPKSSKVESGEFNQEGQFEFVKKFQQPDWKYLYFKVKSKISNEGYQDLLNLTSLGRTGVRKCLFLNGKFSTYKYTYFFNRNLSIRNLYSTL